MCSYIVKRAVLCGSAKGPTGWMRIDTANIYYDHPFHSPLDHVLGIDFVSRQDGAGERVAVELSASSARALVRQILAVLESGEAEHAAEGSEISHEESENHDSANATEPAGVSKASGTAI